MDLDRDAAKLTAVLQSRDPLPNVSGTIPELDAIRFAPLETHRVLVHRRQLDQA